MKKLNEENDKINVYFAGRMFTNVNIISCPVKDGHIHTIIEVNGYGFETQYTPTQKFGENIKGIAVSINDILYDVAGIGLYNNEIVFYIFS